MASAQADNPPAGRAPDSDLRARLLTACGSEAWAEAVAAGWPYPNLDHLLHASERAFDALHREDWLQAFAAHARIGAPRAGDVQGAAEQAGVAAAASAELAELERLNVAYERRFGHVFLICATGLGADQMLSALRERILNAAPTEFANAQAEQRKITTLRLKADPAP